MSLLAISPSLHSYLVKIKARVPFLSALAIPFPPLPFGSIVWMDNSPRVPWLKDG